MPVAEKQVGGKNVIALNYDSDTEVLRVTQSGSNVYEYSDVPNDVAEELFTADNIESYFRANVKSNFPWAKVSPVIEDDAAVETEVEE